MSVFPKVQNPCPYRSRLASVIEGDTCRMCKRQVHDLAAMTDSQRLAFLSGCREEVCVSYRLRLRPAVAAAALAAAAVTSAVPAAAQEEEDVLIVGGIADPRKVELVEDTADGNLPDMPVVYEDERPAEPETKAEVSRPSGA